MNITNKAIMKYRKYCNHNTDGYSLSKKKILRMVALGKKVYTYKDSENHYIIRYCDMNVEVLYDTVVTVWRDWTNEFVKRDYEAYVKYNAEHGLVSRRDV